MADPTASAVEEIRKRVMREAEEANLPGKCKGLIQGASEEAQSYKTASSGMDGGPTFGGQMSPQPRGPMWVPNGVVGGQPRVLLGPEDHRRRHLEFKQEFQWETQRCLSRWQDR